MHLSEGKLHKISLCVSLIKPAIKEGHLPAKLSSETLSVFLQPLQYCEFAWEASSWGILHIYIYVLVLNRASHMLLRKEKRKSSNAFSLMILFYKDMILYVCMMHLASKLSRTAPIPSCFWFSPLSRNFCLFGLISKKSTSSPQYCSCLPGWRTNWPDSKILQLFFTFILSTPLQSISDEK